MKAKIDIVDPIEIWRDTCFVENKIADLFLPALQAAMQADFERLIRAIDVYYCPSIEGQGSGKFGRIWLSFDFDSRVESIDAPLQFDLLELLDEAIVGKDKAWRLGITELKQIRDAINIRIAKME